MNFRLLAFGCSLLVLPACATVNIADMDTSNTSAVQKVEANVVVKASNTLQDRFVQTAWVEAAGLEMKQAAMTLLKGYQSRPASPTVKYILTVAPDQLQADIAEAAHLAAQTTKAADVYFAYADKGADLTAELQSLERALLDCRKAESTFEKALSKHQLNMSLLSSMTSTVNSLQSWTDKYGKAVRESRMSELPSTAAVN